MIVLNCICLKVPDFKNLLMAFLSHIFSYFGRFLSPVPHLSSSPHLKFSRSFFSLNTHFCDLIVSFGIFSFIVFYSPSRRHLFPVSLLSLSWIVFFRYHYIYLHLFWVFLSLAS